MKNPNILVPLDFSELGNRALSAAAVFAKTFKGTVTPFHAYIPITDLDGFYYMGTGFSNQDNFTEVESVLLDRLEETAANHIDSHLLKPAAIEVGNPAQAICHVANNYDLIVMGTHGRSGFSRFFMGSVTEKVLRICHKPILVVEEKSNLNDLQKIMLTTDFSENSFYAFPLAKEISQATGGSIDLVHVVSNVQLGKAEDETTTTAARERESRLYQLAEEYFGTMRDRVKPEILVSDKSPHEVIAELNKSRKYNLIVMSTLGRTGLDYLRMGSTTSNVARNVEAAVLGISPQPVKQS